MIIYSVDIIYRCITFCCGHNYLVSHLLCFLSLCQPQFINHLYTEVTPLILFLDDTSLWFIHFRFIMNCSLSGLAVHLWCPRIPLTYQILWSSLSPWNFLFPWSHAIFFLSFLKKRTGECYICRLCISENVSILVSHINWFHQELNSALETILLSELWRHCLMPSISVVAIFSSPLFSCWSTFKWPSIFKNFLYCCLLKIPWAVLLMVYLKSSMDLKKFSNTLQFQELTSAFWTCFLHVPQSCLVELVLLRLSAALGMSGNL